MSINEYFNEIVIILTVYTTMCFTDWVPNRLAQHQAGLVTCVILCLHLAINLLLIVNKSFKLASLNLRKIFMQIKAKYNFLQSQRNKKVETVT